MTGHSGLPSGRGWMTPGRCPGRGRQGRHVSQGGIARVDNVFQMTRRLVNAFERLLGTSSSQNSVWHGCQSCNPAMLGKYLTVNRAVANFNRVRADGRTPAMRLGLAR